MTEKWRGDALERYSYYWLTSNNELKIGWDNAAHHKKLENFPHHKHIAGEPSPQPSNETTLNAVMQVFGDIPFERERRTLPASEETK